MRVHGREYGAVGIEKKKHISTTLEVHTNIWAAHVM
jgi:hypothetical protein